MKNKRKTVSIVLIALGCLILMYPLFTQWKVDQSQQHAEQEWEKLNHVYATTNSIDADYEKNPSTDNTISGQRTIEAKETEDTITHDSTTVDHRQEVEKHRVLGH